MRVNPYIASLLALAILLVGPFAHASEPAASKPTNIVVLGDSLAAGYGLDPAMAFPALLQKRIAEAGWSHIKVVNAGVSGDTSAGGLRRLDWVLKRPVDVLVIALGGNDGLRGIAPQSMKRNLESMIQRTRAKYPEARIVLAGMKMPPNLGQYATEFERVFPEVAREQEVTLIPFLLEGVGGKPDLNLPDRIHPTAEGQKIVADNVWAVLKPILAKSAE